MNGKEKWIKKQNMKETRVFSIDPNTSEYFEDKIYVDRRIFGGIYYGRYRAVPIYPLYTFSASPNGVLVCDSNDIIMEFVTMIPIEKLFCTYLVETRFQIILDVRESNILNFALDSFNDFCETSKKTISVNGLIKHKK